MVPFTELISKTASLGLGKNGQFHFGQLKFEIPVRYLNEEITQAVGYMSPEFRGAIRTTLGNH